MLLRLIAFGAIAAVALSSACFAQQPPQQPQAWPPGPGSAPPAPGQPSPQNQLCTRLEAQLASVDRGNAADPARGEQLRRYEEASAKQQAELDRMVAQGRKAGCEGSGFFLFNALQSQQCVDVNRQISNMRANLDRINVDLQRLRGNDVDRGEQRRSVIAALAQNNCGPQYRTAARAPGGFFDQLFGRENGEGEPAPSGDLANPEAQGGSVRTVCVRTCDGYYFPISYATNASRFAQDEKTCQRMALIARFSPEARPVPIRASPRSLMSAQKPSVNAFQTPAIPTNGCAGRPCRLATKATITISEAAISSPGMKPAMNRRPIETSAVTP